MEFAETKDSHKEPLLAQNGINESMHSLDDPATSEQMQFENDMQASHVFSDDEDDKDESENHQKRNAIFKCDTLAKRDALKPGYLGNNREGNDPLTR